MLCINNYIYIGEYSQVLFSRFRKELGWHLYMIQIDSKVLIESRREIFDEMRARNIGVHVHYIPVYWQPYYQDLGYERGLCPVAEERKAISNES